MNTSPSPTILDFATGARISRPTRSTMTTPPTTEESRLISKIRRLEGERGQILANFIEDLVDNLLKPASKGQSK